MIYCTVDRIDVDEVEVGVPGREPVRMDLASLHRLIDEAENADGRSCDACGMTGLVGEAGTCRECHGRGWV